MFDTRSATLVLAEMGSGTITTATLLSPSDHCQVVLLTFRWIDGEGDGFIPESADNGLNEYCGSWSHLQLMSGYLEMEDYTKALGKTREAIKQLHALATSLVGLANGGCQCRRIERSWSRMAPQW
jgi:hypothetical protein